MAFTFNAISIESDPIDCAIDCVGVYCAAELVGKLFEVMQVKLVVRFAVETDRAIIAALDDVPGNAGK